MFTLMELIVSIGLILIVAAMLLPALAAAKRKTSRIGCVNNLKQMDLAFKIWANDNDGKYPMEISVTNGGAMEFAKTGIAYRIFQVMSNEINAPRILYCPMDTNHLYAVNFTTDFNSSKISYFVRLDASEQNPESVLLGDDNFIVDEKPVRPSLLNLTSNSIVKWSDERHRRAGNLAFTDGSVAPTVTRQLKDIIAVTGTGTNRLVIP